MQDSPEFKELASGIELSAVKEAINNSQWMYRTAEGIERETGIAAERIGAILNSSPEIARKTAFADPEHKDRTIYAPADSKKTLRERVAEIRWILAR